MQFEVINVLSKLKSQLSLDKDGELAEAMGVNVRTYASWKSRNTIDFILLLNFCKKNKISLDWLFENEVQNTINEPTEDNKNERKSKVDNLEDRIVIIENILKTKLKE